MGSPVVCSPVAPILVEESKIADKIHTQPTKIGLTSATSLVVANMIGAGVFTTSGFALADLGSPGRVLAAWLVGGLIAICGAVTYGMLAQHIRESGGEYVFLSRLVHPFAGFLAGWVSLLAGFTSAIAFAATTLEAYSFPGSHGVVAVLAIVVCGALHLIGLRFGATGQNFVVAIKLALIVGFLFIAIRMFPSQWPVIDIETPSFSIFAFAMSLVWISLSYSGFNAAVYLAEEVEDSQRQVPRALWIGTLSVMVIYLILNAIFVNTPPASAIAGREDVAAACAEILGGRRLALGIRTIICLALFSSISSMVMIGPRVYARMADDGVFPKIFSSTARTPNAAIGLQVALASAIAMATPLQALLSYLGFTLSISAAATGASVFVLRSRGTPFGAAKLVAAACYIGATLTLASLAAYHRPWQLAGTLATVASGGAVYAVMRWWRHGS